MAANTNHCQYLSEFRKHVREAELRKNELETSEFTVLTIHRYISDPKHALQTGLVLGEQTEALDVMELTLGDSKHKLKVILDQALNKLVQTCRLQAGHKIIITGCRLYFDETDITSGRIAIVTSLEVRGFTEIQDQTELTRLQWAPDCSVIEQADVPLTSSRGYYVSIWSPVEMYGDIWNHTVASVAGLGGINPLEIYHIKDIARSFHALRSADPVLLVRVLQKSRIFHYGKVDKDHKWPLQAQLLIGDKTGACTVVLWNNLCPHIYYSIKEGMVLLLRKFKVKKSYAFFERTRPPWKNIQFYDVDLDMNYASPPGDIRIINEASVPRGSALPNIQYTFIDRRQAGCLPMGYICDVAGVVTFVGRYEREPIFSKFGTEGKGFWIRRWIQLRDSSSSKPFFLQVYRSLEGLHGLDIRPGMLVMCTHMRVVTSTDQLHSSRVGYGMFLSTTSVSRLCVLDDPMTQSLQREPVIGQLVRWASTRACTDLVASSVVGGYLNFPPLPPSIDELQTCFKEWQITPSDNWEGIMTDFSYRECRQIMVQATLAHVKLSPDNLAQYTVPGSPSKRRAGYRGLTEISVDGDVMTSLQFMTCVGDRQLVDDLSFPVHYRADQWAKISQYHAFPAQEISVGPRVHDTAGLKFQAVPYYTITWLGLNGRIILMTHLIPPPYLTDRSTFAELMSGAVPVPRRPLPGGDHLNTMSQVMSTAMQCKDRRFLLVLDCYQADVETTEIMLNRAIML